MPNPRQQAQASTVVHEHLVHAFFPLTFGGARKGSRPAAMLEAWSKHVLELRVVELSERLEGIREAGNSPCKYRVPGCRLARVGR